MEIPLLTLLLLQAKHFVCDFVTQTPYQSRNKGIYGHPGGLLHAAHHLIGSAVVLTMVTVLVPTIPPTLIAALLAAEFVLHYHFDWGKEQVVKPFVAAQGIAYWTIFGFDQFLHQATYVVMVYMLFRA